ncbi:MAG: xanthine dehydrogenase family protein subunit M [Candidatus Aminicenantes bacterium]|nr:MAG: xanthine dehydrogenase family protein subunit M [Candidatus Aminicenantes bacterium]
MRRFDYLRPKSLKEALQQKKTIAGAKFISGGTDLLVQIKNRELQPPTLISLRSIPELATIEINGGARIGALATISDIIQHNELGLNYPVLVEAARRLGSVQIRNVATVGGNLCNCSPSADMALPLLVLEAKVRLRTAKARREIQISEFFKGPGESCLSSDEILTDIILDPPHQKAKATFLKKGRVKMDLAIASLAVLLEMEGGKCRKARIAAGSVAPVPLRLYKVEALLEGSTVTEKLAAEAQRLATKIISPITDIRATEEYRRQIVRVYVKRGLEKILG